MGEAALFRITPLASIDSSSDIILYNGVLEKYVANQWTQVATNKMVLLQWPTAGDEKLPSSVSEITDRLRAAPTATVHPPMIVRLNATEITTLSLGSSTVSHVVLNDGTELKNPIVYKNGNETIINLTACTGRTSIYLVDASSVTVGVDSDNLTVTISGYKWICGNLRINGSVIKDWASVRYLNNNTLVTFPSTYDSSVTLLYSNTNIGRMVVPRSKLIDVQQEYPLPTLDSNYTVIDSYAIVRNGSTQIRVATVGLTYINVLMPDWLYRFLNRGGNTSRVEKLVNVEPPPVPTPQVVMVDWNNILNRPRHSAAQIDAAVLRVADLENQIIGRTVQHLVTEEEALAKEIVILDVPVFPETVELIVDGAPPLIRDRDWYYDEVNHKIVWNEKGLDGLLTHGELVEYRYK